LASGAVTGGAEGSGLRAVVGGVDEATAAGRGVRTGGVTERPGSGFVTNLNLKGFLGIGAGEPAIDAAGLGRETIEGAGDCLDTECCLGMKGCVGTGDCIDSEDFGGTEDCLDGAGELLTEDAFAGAGWGVDFKILSIFSELLRLKTNLIIFVGRGLSSFTEGSCSTNAIGRFFC